MTKREPFVAYIRVSTYYEEKISPEIQRSAIKAWADRNNANIVEWINDLDVSGRKTRRKISNALKMIEGRTARGIAVWRYSRFGRSRHGNAINLARLEALGGRLASATEAADTRTAFGRLQMGMAFKFAEYESDRIGEQWGETREHRRTAGLPATGGKRWGYIWHQRHLDDAESVIHREWYEPNDTGLIVTNLYERIAEGESMGSVTQWLGKNGHIGTRGKPWLQSGLSRYMDSGFAAGWIRYHPDDCDCPPKDPDSTASRGALCPNRIWIPGAHEPIVPEDVWEAYKEKRAKARNTPSGNRKPAYALSGLMRCARCGGTASAAGGATYGAGKVLIPKPGYMFRCSKMKDNRTCDGVYILRSIAEDAVLQRLVDWSEAIEAEAASIPQQSNPDSSTPRQRINAARERLRARLAEIQQQLDRQTDLLTRGVIPEDSYTRERDRLTQEQTGTTAELAELDKRTEEQEAKPADYQPIIRGLIDRWEITPVETRRELLRSVLRGVWAYPKSTAPDGTEVPAYAVPVAIWEDEPRPIGPRANA
ncbi:recombinase family protein [Streptomyces shenzhenensis]|uniref:Recombinase family protein n=1 Tax=Streptomyces shenzhenensis TaxID=943815 RepID=A0A3M0I5Y0_9ACTN|nr:recombinase family protein [Streptomyces shenzhenensis]RMB83682.1 recombinase family protein [Streptomyces shenzhenensis]